MSIVYLVVVDKTTLKPLDVSHMTYREFYEKDECGVDYGIAQIEHLITKFPNSAVNVYWEH